MKKQKLQRSFNLKELNNQIKDENSCIYMQRLPDHLAFHPYHLSDLNNSVNEILNTHVGKYCPRLGGILCGYRNIKFLSQSGYICDDSCFIHVDTEADYFLFKPTKGSLLRGFVNKRSKDHVGCLVHNIFNVSLPKPKNSEEWIGDSLNVNDEVELKVSSTDFDRKLPYIKGKIVSIVNKYENEQTSPTEENTSSKNTKLCKKKILGDGEQADEHKSSKKQKKKFKKVNETFTSAFTRDEEVQGANATEDDENPEMYTSKVKRANDGDVEENNSPFKKKRKKVTVN